MSTQVVDCYTGASADQGKREEAQQHYKVLAVERRSGGFSSDRRREGLEEAFNKKTMRSRRMTTKM